MNHSSHMSDSEVLAATAIAARDERRVTTELVALLAELDARRLYLAEGCSSLFGYCTQVLHLSEHAAYHRIEAARAARQYPVILELLAKGGAMLIPAETTAAPASGQPAPSTTVVPIRPAIAPLAPDRYLLRVTLSASAHAKLRRAQDLLRHKLPSGDAAAVVEQALELLVDQLEKAKSAKTSRPRKALKAAGNPLGGSRHIPAPVKRSVWSRDAGRCAFVGSHGRCRETGHLEYHHLIPFARGGSTDVGNIALRCRAHNLYEAERAGLTLWREQGARSGPSSGCVESEASVTP